MGVLSDLGMTENDTQDFVTSLLHSYILLIMAYGMYTVVYCVALYLTLSRGTEKAQIRSSIVITVLWLLGTAKIGIRWATISDIFIHHGDADWNGQMTAYVEAFPLAMANCIVSFLIVISADIVMIWRCWALHGQRWIVITAPILSLVVGIAVFILQTVIDFSASERKAPILRSTREMIFLGTTVFTNIFCTAAIIYCLISVGGFVKALKTYRGVMEIFVESAILYTTIYFIQIGMNVYATYFSPTWDGRYLYVHSLCTVVTVLAPTLIIARVSAGHARPNYSWTSTSVPDMRTTGQSLQESIRFAGPVPLTSSDVDIDRNTETHDSVSSLEIERVKEETKV